jgi:hypothetical protein
MANLRIAALLCLLASTACLPGEDAKVAADETGESMRSADPETHFLRDCSIVEKALRLPDEVRESSGLALGRLGNGVFWTHNDAGNEAEIFAIDETGGLVQRVRVANAEADDWEDIESGMCEGGACLYIADIGDNNGKRDHVTIYRIAEPANGQAESAPAVALRAEYPDGAQDAESLFALPGGELYVVTKGHNGPIALYRYPLPPRPEEVVTLERVVELFPEPDKDSDRITGATASPNGKWAGIRSHRMLYVYDAVELVSGSAEPMSVDLEPLAQPQGESVVIADDGAIWLSTEAAKKSERPTMGRLQCTFPGG